MKKLLAASIFSVLILPFVALGLTGESPPSTPELYPSMRIEETLNWLIFITIIVTIVFLIIAAINKITAGKNIKKHKIARRMMICAAISAAIVIIAVVIIIMLNQGLIRCPVN